MPKRDREDLVGATRGIVAALAVDYVVKIAALSVPEALVEGCKSQVGVLVQVPARGLVAPGYQPTFKQPQSVVPERVDLYGLPAPRSHDPLTHLRVHPGQLVAVGALVQQAIFSVHADAEARPGAMVPEDFAQRRQQTLERGHVTGQLHVPI